jgi:diguanylate cyclase (GGDEF)-like protein/PAS domain S-box-containing protein
MHQDIRNVSIAEAGRLTAKVFSRLILASWGVLLSVLLVGIFLRDARLSGFAAAGVLFLLIPYLLARAGHVQLSGFIVVAVVQGLVTALAAAGQGIRDIGIVAFPVIIIFAGLTLPRGYFRVSVGLTLLATVSLAAGEKAGWFAPLSAPGYKTTWFYLAGVILILGVAFVAVELLTTRMRRNMELARQEYVRRVEVDDTLRNSETQFRFLVNHTSDDILRLDANGKMVFVSDTARNFLGYEPSDLLMLPAADFVHPDDRGRYAATLTKVIETGLPGRVEYRLRRSDESYLWVEATGRRVFGTVRQPEVILVQRDISERKLAEQHNRLIFEIQDALLRPDSSLDIRDLVAGKVAQLIADGIVVVTCVDAKRGTVRLGTLHGMELPMQQLSGLLGYDPQVKEFALQEPTEENTQIFHSPRLLQIEQGLATLAQGTLPPAACALIEKLLRIKDVYLMGLIHNDAYIGSLIILARADIAAHTATIEQIVNLATIAIERVQAETEVTNSARRFTAMIENGRDNISLLDAAGNLLWENPSGSSTLGYRPDVFIGRSIFELLHPDDRAETLALFAQVVQTPGALRAAQFRLRHADGSWRWIESTGANMLEVPYLEAVVLNYRDITERKRAQDALLESETRFKLSMDATNDGLWDWDILSGVCYFGPNYYRMLGYAVGEFPAESRAWEALIHPEDRAAAVQINQDCIEGRRETFEVEYRMHAKNGEYRWILGRGKCVARDAQGRALRLLGTHMDITARKEIEAALQAKTEELDLYFRSSLDLFCIADRAGIFRRVNPQWEATLGFSIAELEGQPILDFIHPEDQAATAATLQLSAQDSILNFTNRYRCKDGSYRWIEWRSVPVKNLIYAAARDITERKNLEEQLRYQSTHDDMTRIYNRAYFEAELARFERGREYPVSIVIADFDRLKAINDNLGHPFGDELLRQTAQVLSSVFRAGDVLARLGGDEFGALLPATDEQAVGQIAARIRESLAEHNARSLDVPLELSIGAATGEHGSLAEVFTLADQRMYANKAVRKAQPLENGVHAGTVSAVESTAGRHPQA